MKFTLRTFKLLLLDIYATWLVIGLNKKYDNIKFESTEEILTAGESLSGYGRVRYRVNIDTLDYSRISDNITARLSFRDVKKMLTKLEDEAWFTCMDKKYRNVEMYPNLYKEVKDKRDARKR